MFPARITVRVLAVPTATVVVAEVLAAAVAGHLGDRVYIGVAALIAVTTVALAVLVSQRRPDILIAPLLSVMGLLAALVSFSDTYLPIRARRPDVLPDLPGPVVAMLVALWVWLYIAVALLMLLFPDGRLHEQRWRWVGGGLLVVGVAIQVLMVVSPGPYDAPYAAVPHPFGELPGPAALAAKIALFPTLVVLTVLCAGAMWAKHRRGDAVVRAQLKWLALAALGIPATAILSWVGFLLFGTNTLAGVGFAFLYAAVPIAVTVAVLRHNLYDVDRALSGALTYGATSVVLLTAFATTSAISGALLGHSSVPVAVTTTAVVAVALAPVRRAAQRGVDRRVYPMRRDALQAVEGLRVQIQVADGHPEQLQDVLRAALRDPGLRVGYRTTPGRTVDAEGNPLTLDSAATAVTVRGVPIGSIVSDGPASNHLKHEVAGASALLVEMGRLGIQASAALREAESSRARMLRLGYEERRRLERDLHDGAQQRLVSLGMSLRLAQRHLGDNNPIDVDGLLDESVAQLGTAVAELRQIAHGLRPSCLDDGLFPAISVLTSSVPIPIDLDVAADRAVPDDIATTAYYVVSEAIANAVKHAEASRIRLRIAHDDDHLRVFIHDDGRGGAAVRPGSGLAGLTDRVAAAGGLLLVVSRPGEGTTIEARLPCAS